MSSDPRYRVVGNPHGYYRIQERVPDGGTFLDNRGCERTARKDGWYVRRSPSGCPFTYAGQETAVVLCTVLNGQPDFKNAGPWEPVG